MKRLPEKRRQGLAAYASSKPTIGTEILYLAPLAVVYHAGAKVTGVYNGVDVVSPLLETLKGAWPWGVWFLEAALLIGFVSLYGRSVARESFRWRDIWRTLLEGGLYGAAMGWFVVLVLLRILHVSPALAGGTAHGPLTALQVSAGAGFYEELVFRFGLYGGFVWLLDKKLSPWLVRPAVALVAAFLFALCHHLPPSGEPVTLWALSFRTVSGLVLTGIYEWRGLAVAAYAHAFYDVLVFWQLI